MALGADDMQSPCRHHLLMLPLTLLLHFGYNRFIQFFLHQIQVIPLAFELFFSQKLRIAAQENIGTSAGHISGNSDTAQTPGLGHNLRFLFMIFGI